jgi:hypothetical protein
MLTWHLAAGECVHCKSCKLVQSQLAELADSEGHGLMVCRNKASQQMLWTQVTTF